MADYWKSQPRKFCQYCKCWIADNKPSVDFHERGKNHKENVAAKIAEIKKKSVQKAKQDKKMCKQFAAMEEAAAKAYEEDLKRMGIEGGTSFAPEVDPTSTTSPYQPEPTEQPQKPTQTNKQGPKQGPKQKPPEPKPPVQLPPHPQHPPHPPYPQHIPQHIPRRTEASLWVEATSSEGHIYYYNRLSGESRWDKPEGFKGINDAPPPPGTTEISTVCAWMEAVSPEGHTYYYNTVTRASSWEKPPEYIPKAAPEPSEQGEGQGEPSNTEKAEEAAAEEEEEEEEATSEQTSTGTTEQGSQQSTVPKVQFRKRKAVADPSEAGEDTPKEGEKDQNEESGTTESEMKEKKDDETPTGRFRPRNPYGTWERIKLQKDPYTSVDWQLPQVQAGEDTVALELPPEPKHKFKTRVITSLGDSASSSGPVSFKKKKTQNGKSRSLRQRDDDD